jgi:hypothetical protein
MPHKPKQTLKKIETVDILHVRATTLAELFGQSAKLPKRWEQQGCPRNSDGSFNLREVLKWRDAKQASDTPEKSDLERKKISLQCEKLQAELDDLRAQNIPLSTHQAVLASRANSFKKFWVDVFRQNLHTLAHKSIDQLRPISERLVKESLNYYSREHK